VGVKQSNESPAVVKEEEKAKTKRSDLPSNSRSNHVNASHPCPYLIWLNEQVVHGTGSDEDGNWAVDVG